MRIPGHTTTRRATAAAAALALLLCSGAAEAQTPPDPDRFCAALFAGDSLAWQCASGPAGSDFPLRLLLWVPPGSGLNYVTIRFDFPGNIGLSGRPALNGLAMELIPVDFADGTVEWTILFDGCPEGWVEVLRQTCVLLDEAPSTLRMIEAYSLARHCDFVLEGVVVMNDFRVNDPSCPFVGAGERSWGAIKELCR